MSIVKGKIRLGRFAVECRQTRTKVSKTINSDEGTYPDRLMNQLTRV